MRNISKLLNQESHRKAILRAENTIKIRILIKGEKYFGFVKYQHIERVGMARTCIYQYVEVDDLNMVIASKIIFV